MKEKNENQEKTFSLPPAWCGALCRNSMNEVCVEHCAIKRDCSAFEPMPNLNLSDMPRFPQTEGMTREEKFTSVTVYLAKVVDHLQGVEYEEPPITIRRAARILNIHEAVAQVASSLNETASNDQTILRKESE